MASLGLRARLFLLSVLMILVCGVPSALYLEHQLRTWLEARVEADVERQARLLMRSLWPLAEGDALDERVDELGVAAGVRLTLIARDGRVLADSKVPTRRLAKLDSHKQRPEVAAAQQAGRGVARRHSKTLNTKMLYVAVRGPAGVVVRTAVPLEEVDALFRRFHVFIGFAALLALLLATVMTFVATRLVSEPVRGVLERTRPLVRASADSPSTLRSDSMPALARQLDQAVANLADERDRLAAIVNALTDGVVVLDGDGGIELSNPAARELLGAEDLSPEHLKPFADAAEQTVEWSSNNSARTVIATAAPLNFGGQVIVLHDVTQRRRLENVRKDFIANVSHELRTPVSIMRANAETLLDRGLEDKDHGRGFVEAILRHSERLGHLITDLLDLSRLEAGRVRLWLQPVVLADAAQVARASLQDKADQQKIEVFIEAEGDIAAFADAKGVDQIITNLLGNALKHTPEGGRIDVRISATGSLARLTVEDDGPGIPEEHHERIFERFYRVDPGRSRDVGGTGLGLAIVRHWAEALNGTVGVGASSRGGAQFWLELPLAGDSVRPQAS